MLGHLDRVNWKKNISKYCWNLPFESIFQSFFADEIDELLKTLNFVTKFTNSCLSTEKGIFIVKFTNPMAIIISQSMLPFSKSLFQTLTTDDIGNDVNGLLLQTTANIQKNENILKILDFIVYFFAVRLLSNSRK